MGEKDRLYVKFQCYLGFWLISFTLRLQNYLAKETSFMNNLKGCFNFLKIDNLKIKYFMKINIWVKGYTCIHYKHVFIYNKRPGPVCNIIEWTVKWLRYQNWYGHPYSFNIHFDIFLTWNMKNGRNLFYVFCGEVCWKLLCWHFNCAFLLFYTGARLSQRARIQEISCWEDIEEAILVDICPIKQCFYVIITQSLLCVWNKDTIQVSDQFWSRICGVKTIKWMHGNDCSTSQISVG